MKTLLIILISPVLLFSQDLSSTLSKKKALRDYETFMDLIDAHPDPFRHITEEDFYKRVDKNKSEITDGINTLEFYKLLSEVMALIKDGHSSISLPRNYLKNVRKESGAFPYKVHVSNEDRLYIVKSYSEENKIPAGTEILAINEMPISSFIETVDPYISYERMPFRNVILELSFESHLLLAFGTTTGIQLEYKEGAEVKNELVKNIDYKLWEKEIKSDREDRENRIADGRPYQYKKIADGIGMLSIYSFSVPDINKYEFFLRKTFGEIAKDDISYLIMDVRGNFGGYPKVSAMLIHYLTNTNFKTMAVSQMKISKAYRNYFKNNMGGLAGYTGAIGRTSAYQVDLNTIMRGKIGDFNVEEAIFIEEPESMNNEFNGILFLLADRRSYSAASSFAAIFNCYGFGSIIGEETGGTNVFHANAIGDVLSHSKIYVNIATTKLFCTCIGETDEGVQPDFPVSPSVLQLVNDVDSQLNFTLRLIKKHQKAMAAKG